ncbi:hypothetical protein C1H46_015749 [Malus baccata]|uniref:Uncharacterized protein n=1 Tax=Malus baccata TaxID=106549 RepID=A0A540MIB0_MALBA|nr:hypothetical protein C1H46_015749 [Malus baccata]
MENISWFATFSAIEYRIRDDKTLVSHVMYSYQCMKLIDLVELLLDGCGIEICESLEQNKRQWKAPSLRALPPHSNYPGNWAIESTKTQKPSSPQPNKFGNHISEEMEIWGWDYDAEKEKKKNQLLGLVELEDLRLTMVEEGYCDGGGGDYVKEEGGRGGN